MSVEIKNGMEYTRYTEKGTGTRKWKVGQRIETEFVTKAQKATGKWIDYEPIQRRKQQATIVAITVRKNPPYRDVWFKLDFVDGFGFWTTNVHRVTRYI